VLVTLTQAKQYLDVIHTFDDAKLTLLLNAAIDEAIQFCGYDTAEDFEDYLDSSESIYNGTPDGFVMGVLLLVQGNYQSSPDDVRRLRDAAEIKLMPYRVGLGI